MLFRSMDGAEITCRNSKDNFKLLIKTKKGHMYVTEIIVSLNLINSVHIPLLIKKINQHKQPEHLVYYTYTTLGYLSLQKTNKNKKNGTKR